MNRHPFAPLGRLSGTRIKELIACLPKNRPELAGEPVDIAMAVIENDLWNLVVATDDLIEELRSTIDWSSSFLELRQSACRSSFIESLFEPAPPTRDHDRVPVRMMYGLPGTGKSQFRWVLGKLLIELAHKPFVSDATGTIVHSPIVSVALNKKMSKTAALREIAEAYISLVTTIPPAKVIGGSDPMPIFNKLGWQHGLQVAVTDENQFQIGRTRSVDTACSIILELRQASTPIICIANNDMVELIRDGLGSRSARLLASKTLFKPLSPGSSDLSELVMASLNLSPTGVKIEPDTAAQLFFRHTLGIQRAIFRLALLSIRQALLGKVALGIDHILRAAASPEYSATRVDLDWIRAVKKPRPNRPDLRHVFPEDEDRLAAWDRACKAAAMESARMEELIRASQPGSRSSPPPKSKPRAATSPKGNVYEMPTSPFVDKSKSIFSKQSSSSRSNEADE